MKRKVVSLRSDQQGFAAIVIAIVLVLVLSLITVGFASLMRKEQRQALDKQLSSQAYYAAESGINDAVQALSSGYTANKITCGPYAGAALPPGSASLKDNTVGTNTGASYPCLLINQTPPSLEYGSVGTTVPKVVELTAVGPDGVTHVPITSIKVSWEDTGSNTNFVPSSVSPNCQKFFPAGPAANQWSYIGLLRFQLIPVDLKNLNRDSINNSAYTTFMCPNDGTNRSTPGSASYGTNTTNGEITFGNCKNSNPGQPQACNVSIGSLPAGQATYLVDMRSIYNPTKVTLTVYDASGTQLNIKDAQALVDSTGKAQDVLRRIQVRVPLHNNYDIPDGTHGNAAICKQLDLVPSGTPNFTSNSHCQ